MKYIIDTMDLLLAAYERNTPCIDQNLVRKALEAMAFCRKLMAAGLLVLAMVVPGAAFDKSQNPDKYPSIGLDVSTGKIPGMLKTVAAGQPQTDGGFVKGALDFRMPISNALTIRAFGSSTGINNNLEFSEGHELGIGLRVYIQ